MSRAARRARHSRRLAGERGRGGRSPRCSPWPRGLHTSPCNNQEKPLPVLGRVSWCGHRVRCPAGTIAFISRTVPCAVVCQSQDSNSALFPSEACASCCWRDRSVVSFQAQEGSRLLWLPQDVAEFLHSTHFDRTPSVRQALFLNGVITAADRLGRMSLSSWGPCSSGRER